MTRSYAFGSDVYSLSCASASLRQIIIGSAIIAESVFAVIIRIIAPQKNSPIII